MACLSLVLSFVLEPGLELQLCAVLSLSYIFHLFLPDNYISGVLAIIHDHRCKMSGVSLQSNDVKDFHW